MVHARRIAFLRITTMAALVASAVLTADHWRPGRPFCPLEAACDLASGSALGSFFGVPTAVVGLAAFGGLFLLTLLPVEWARVLLRPAGLLALLAGVGFVAYQAFVLHSFCPLCVVADVAGFLAGVTTLTWPRPPMRLSGRLIPQEPISGRMAWAFAALLAVVLPFAVPRAEEPAWVEITPMAEADLDPEGSLGAAVPHGEIVREEAEPTASVAVAPPRSEPVAGAHQPALPQRQAAATTRPLSPAGTRTPASTAPVRKVPVPEPPAARPSTRVRAATTAQARPAETAVAHATRPADAGAPKRPVIIVEYLNAYCAHCRATHHRLERVVAETNAPIRRRHVYTWASNDYPAWARACDYARTIGREEEMFAELMRAPNASTQEVYAAARRAGLDLGELRCVLVDRAPSRRLVRDRDLMRGAGLRGLPTIDIGRRRLMGEQTEAELRDAVEAALQAQS